MALRTALINGTNINQDYDFGYLLQSIVQGGGCVEGLEVQSGKVVAGKGFIPCERTNGDKPFVFVELPEDFVVDTTGTKKVWIEIPQAKLDDGSSNNEDGTGIAEIKTGANYPASNYIPLASITGGTITDERVIIKLKSANIPRPVFNQSIRDLYDVYNFADPTTKVYLARDVVEKKFNALPIESVDLPGFNKNYVYGENITSKKCVSLMPDGKVYASYGNKRLLNNGTITGQTYTKSCLINGGEKIATLGLATNTLTLWIGTIDYATNTITYGNGVLVSSNCSNGSRYFNICEANTDTVYISYTHTGHYGAGRSASINGTVPTIGNETNMTGTSEGNESLECVKVSNGVVGVILYYYAVPNRHENICGVAVSGTSITKGSEAAIFGDINNARYNDGLYRISENVLLFGYGINSSGASAYGLATFNGTVPTVGTQKSYGTGATGDYKAHYATDGTYIYAVATDGYLRKYSYSGNTLTEIWNKASFPNENMMLIGGSLLGVNSTGNSIKRYSLGSTGVTERNTIDYGISLGRLGLECYYSTNNYAIITVSGNPSYIYKIGNELRRIVGMTYESGNVGETKSVVVDAGIYSGLTNIIPGETYYLDISTGIVGLTGDILFGKGLSSSEMKIAISNVA